MSKTKTEQYLVVSHKIHADPINYYLLEINRNIKKI